MQKRNTWLLALVAPLVVALSIAAQLQVPGHKWDWLVRSFAVAGYLLIFLSILSSASLPALTRTFGRPFIKIHHAISIAGFALIAAHPLTYALAGATFAVFVPRADSVLDFLRWGGRPALFLVLVGVIAVLFRSRMKRSWRYFHWVLYLAFALGTVHSNLIGTSFVTSLGLRVVTWVLLAVATAVFFRRRLRRPSPKK
jgi:methionine sulfoxide reductase heme-binding subunit